MQPQVYRQLVEDASKEYDRVERDLLAKSLEFRRRASERSSGLREVLAALPTDTALVAFVRVRGDNRGRASGASPKHLESESSAFYIAFVATSARDTPSVIRIGDVATIEGAIQKWRGLVAAGPDELRAARSEQAVNAAGIALRRLIWDPLLGALGEKASVLIVPDGVLSLVNLAALPGPDGKYLVESKPVLHTLSTERDVVVFHDPAQTGSGLLAVGGVDFSHRDSVIPGDRAIASALGVVDSVRGRRSGCGSFSGVSFGELPWSNAEAEEVGRAWSTHGNREPVIRLSGVLATETRVRAAAVGKRILHLATHGFFLGDECPSLELGDQLEAENPLLLSGLVFAGANQRNTTESGLDDGILTAQEIATLNLHGTQWAVLSACGTGLGVVESGEGVLGLSRAFQTAGVRTVVMSLWNVEDESARRWMTALYDGLLKQHVGTSRALQAASRQILAERRRRGESTHPYYWGGTVASGDWH
jgi:CHAT domain-containing protein